MEQLAGGIYSKGNSMKAKSILKSIIKAVLASILALFMPGEMLEDIGQGQRR